MISKKQRQEALALENRLAKFTKEEDMVGYLYETKPTLLKMGQEHWLDRNVLLAELKGLEDKLLINGYEDRSKRLSYLQKTLLQKWVNKPTTFNSAIRLLMELSERPTGVLSLDVGETRYSVSPEPIENHIEDENPEEVKEEKRRQEELRKLVVSELLDRSTDLELHFSSDSEANSDWQLSDEDIDLPEMKQGSRLDTPNSKITQQLHEAESASTQQDLKRTVGEFWRRECAAANILLTTKIRKVDPVLLSCQPVISSAVTLHAKFGEFWEWKKQCDVSSKTSRLILMENDIIREILWQLASPNSENSIIFNKNWTFKTEIMVSSLSQSSLSSLMVVYSEILAKLETLNKFIKGVELNKNVGIGATQYLPPSKMHRVYSYGLTQVLLKLSVQISTVEHNLKALTLSGTETCTDQPCTTLIQLTAQLKNYFQVVRSLEGFHSRILNTPTASSHWLSSVKLISSLQMRLNQELSPQLYQIWLYLFIQCLLVFLDIILNTLDTLKWTDSECFFIRNFDIELNHSDFWKDSITSQPIRTKLQELQIIPLSCLRKLIPKLLTTLKILEMVNLLNEEKKIDVVLGRLPTREYIVEEFMNAIVQNPTFIPKKTTTRVRELEKTIRVEDYNRYFNFIGQEDSSVKDCFDFMFTDEIKYQYAEAVEHETPKVNWMDFNIFLCNITFIPVLSIDKTLDDVLETIFDPYFQATRISLYKILESYQVNESILLFREIILGEREDFAQAVDDLAKKVQVAPELSYEDEKYRNQFYQKLLNECYPDGRENFEIEFLLQPRTNLNYRLIVRPNFPLNLILTPKSIQAYLAISRQLHRVRKDLWSLNNLSIKNCKGTDGVEPKRMMFFRFALLHLFSSFRSFLLLKIFSTGFDWTEPISPLCDLDTVIKAHERYLFGIETQVLQDPFLNDVVLRKMSIMSGVLCENWEVSGIMLRSMIKLEDTLHKCWTFLFDFSNSKQSSAICNELASYIGPIPQYLTKHSFKFK